MSRSDRATGALLGLAIGDALGMPTQSMSRAQIVDRYGVITDFVDAAPDQPIAPSMLAGSVTDDTEQAVLVGELLVDGGGHIEPGESPLACILREVEEETGYRLASARFCGLLTWEGFGIPPAGLYIFTAPAPEGQPRPNSEGTLEWKARPWVFTSPEAVSNIHHFGPPVLSGAPPQVYHFAYQNGEILWHTTRPCPKMLL